MVMLEAVSSPIRYSWPRGEIRFVPGAPVQVHEFRGSRILRKCGDKIRVVANQLNPQPERFWIEVNSPSFGWYEAEMLRDDGVCIPSAPCKGSGRAVPVDCWGGDQPKTTALTFKDSGQDRRRTVHTSIHARQSTKDGE